MGCGFTDLRYNDLTDTWDSRQESRSNVKARPAGSGVGAWMGG
jgi:hypothetical protein